ncbi:hypothetical protein [Saccharomonospora sp. CUA-673]|uniref:hypothetical protein n=1 Tax=Saccharomonospora sp. CUA-673 TaxID=1904969 RepID=UPI00096A6BC0|nr:hypothetical protein [Saccharomonospora sp. CUA-673]
MLRRVSVVAVSVSTLMVAGSGVAFADIWGGVDCGQTNYTGCGLGAGADGPPAQPPAMPQAPPEHGGGSDADGGTSGDAPRPQGDQLLSEPNLADCRYVRSDYQPPAQGTTTVSYRPLNDGGAVTVTPAVYRPAASGSRVRPAQQQQPQPRQSGAWYVYQCSGEGYADALYRAPVWIADGERPRPRPAPSPEQLARQAYNQLRLPSLGIHASPAERQLVNLPTWLWMDSGQWRPVTASASVPGVSVTATATPKSVTWSMGDGASVTCDGAGTPFPPGSDPQAASPDCGHTYRQSSRGQGNDSFPVSATVDWTVTWSGAGQRGTFPGLTTTSNTTFSVAESQALNQAPR